MTPAYHKLRDEVRAKMKSDDMTRNQRLALELQIKKDLIATEGKCARCPRTDTLTLDHTIPCTWLETFGIDTDRMILEDNYQLLCRFCNMFKSNRLDFSNPMTKTLLLRLLETA